MISIVELSLSEENKNRFLVGSIPSLLLDPELWRTRQSTHTPQKENKMVCVRVHCVFLAGGGQDGAVCSVCRSLCDEHAAGDENYQATTGV